MDTLPPDVDKRPSARNRSTGHRSAFKVTHLGGPHRAFRNQQALRVGRLVRGPRRAVRAASTNLGRIIDGPTQGEHADQKKSLQYFMFFPFMLIGLVVAHTDAIVTEVLNVVVATSLIDLGLMIWACYATYDDDEAAASKSKKA